MDVHIEVSGLTSIMSSYVQQWQSKEVTIELDHLSRRKRILALYNKGTERRRKISENIFNQSFGYKAKGSWRFCLWSSYNHDATTSFITNWIMKPTSSRQDLKHTRSIVGVRSPWCCGQRRGHDRSYSCRRENISKCVDDYQKHWEEWSEGVTLST